MERLLADDRALSWLALGLATVGVLTALTDADVDGGVYGFVVVALVPFLAHALVPRFPAWVTFLVTTAVVVVVNVDRDAEGAFFLPVIATLLVVGTDPNRGRAYAVAGLAFVAPAVAAAAGSTAAWSFWSMGMLVPTAAGAVLYRQRTLTAELLEARQQLADQAAADERRRIARELHDLVGHSLSVVMLHVTGARHLLRRDVDEAERALLEVERAGRESLAEIRHIVGLLRDADGFGTVPTPGVGDLADLVGEYRRGGLGVALSVHGDTSVIDAVTGLTVYRLVQESLANAAKHAPDARVTVEIDIGASETALQVANGVIGPPSQPRPGGVGIVGMQERARAVGGGLTAGPTASGWLVRARIPHARPGDGVARDELVRPT